MTWPSSRRDHEAEFRDFVVAGQQRLYRLVMYRDLPVRIDGYDYTLYIRNDLLPLYNQIRY